MNRDNLIRQIQGQYGQLGHSMNERERRLWAAAEALKIGRGGITVVSRALRMSPNTVKRGMLEIAAGNADSSSDIHMRIRRPGGGRKPGNRSAQPSRAAESNPSAAKRPTDTETSD